MPTALAADPLATLRELSPTLRREAADVDETRTLSPSTSKLLKEAGVFRLLAPKSIGGMETDPVTFLDVVEEASYADGSVGWCTMIGGCYAAFGGLLPAAGAAELFGDPETIAAGSFNPKGGVAVEVDGGYRLTGRWSLGSGSGHATWFIAGAVVLREGQPVMQPTGMPLMRELFFPASEVTVIDTWDSTGLRGTASHDYEVKDVFVPHDRTVWFQERPVHDGPLYRMPPIAMFAAFIGAVPLGIARHAIEAFIELSKTKVPVLSQAVLAENSAANAALGRAETKVRAAHAYLRTTLAEVWSRVEAGRAPTVADRGDLWAAAAYAGEAALAATELLYTNAGSSAVYRQCAIDRCLRDVRTAVQHICLQEHSFAYLGQLLNGRDALAGPWGMDYRGEV